MGLAKVLDKVNRFESSFASFQVIDAGVIEIKADGRSVCNEKGETDLGIPSRRRGRGLSPTSSHPALEGVLESDAVKDLSWTIRGYDVVARSIVDQLWGCCSARSRVQRFSDEERKHLRYGQSLSERAIGRHTFVDIGGRAIPCEEQEIGRSMAVPTRL